MDHGNDESSHRNKLFISYRRADAAAVAGRLRDALEDAFPGHVFLDVEDILPGQDFAAIIERNLASAAALIVVIGTRWLVGSASGTRLGDPGDYVTLELLTAQRLGVPLLPVLVDGAGMPGDKDLPDVLKGFVRRNAVSVRHSSFRQDCEPILAFLRDVQGLKPPTPFERFIESQFARLPFGSRHFRFDERMREHHALYALAAGIFSVVATAILVATDGSPEIDYLLIHPVLAYTGVIGMNSRRHGGLARIGLVLLLVSFLVQFAMFTLVSTLPDARFGGAL